MFYLCRRIKPETRRAMWGEELQSCDDVYHIFECYITGKKNKNGIKVYNYLLIKLRLYIVGHISSLE